MKKVIVKIICVLTLLVSATAAFACTAPNEEAKSVKVFLPDGAPSVAFAKLMADDASLGNYNVAYNVVSGDAIVAKVLSDEADMAIIPTNAAAIVYNKGKEYTLVSANVYGLLYLIGKGSAASLADLKGKVVVSIGQGNTPEYVFKYLLSRADIPCVNGDTAVEGSVVIKYVSSAAEALPLLLQGGYEYAIVGEPAVTNAKAKGLNSLLDLQALWQSATDSERAYPQASLIVKNSLLVSDPQLIENVLLALEDGEWLNAHAAEIGALMTAAGSSLGIKYTSALITSCNIKAVRAKDAKADIVSYLTVLHGFNPAVVGGKLPDDGFYNT